MIKELEDVRVTWENQRLNSVDNVYKRETYLKNEKQSVNIVASSYLKKPLPFKRFRVEDYPSIRLVQYCQYKKVHHTKKTLTKNDVMDIKLCGIVPYIDKVITEKQQAAFFEEASSVIPELKSIEITTLKDIRK